MAVFGEHPGILQIFGIILALSAILIVNGIGGVKSTTDTVTAPKALILLLLVGGSGDAMSKIYEELGPMEYSSQYLLYTFAAALIICTLTAAVRRRLNRSDSSDIRVRYPGSDPAVFQ